MPTPLSLMRSNALKCCEKLSSNSFIELKSVLRLSMIVCGISGLFGGLRTFVFFNILISAVCALRSADNFALTWCGCNSLPCFARNPLDCIPLAVFAFGVAFLVAFLATDFFPLAMILISCYLVFSIHTNELLKFVPDTVVLSADFFNY